MADHAALPTAPWVAPPEGPLSAYPSFAASVASRLAQGAKEYGDASFARDPGDLVGELQQELLDVMGWGYILWTRLEALRVRLDATLQSHGNGSAGGAR